MKIKRFFLTMFLIFAVSFSFSEDWYWGATLRNIDFVGLNYVKKSDLKNITEEFLGKPFTEQNYSAIVERLYALSYFDDINPKIEHHKKAKNEVELIFTVKEKKSVSSINFSGNRKVRRTDLENAVHLKAGNIFESVDMEKEKQALLELYTKKGFSEAEITYTTTENEDGIDVFFHIKEGKETVIGEIHFEGNVSFTEKTLKKKMSLKEAGAFKKGAFRESALEADKQALLSHYMENGFMDAKISDAKISSAYNEKKERDELILSFSIEEGREYTYEGVSIVGNKVFPTEKLENFIKLTEGDTFNNTKFNAGVAGITNLYYENGYLTTAFLPEAEKDEEKHTIKYKLSIIERPRVHIENIIVKGNKKTKDYVILREIPLESGDVFSRDKLMAGIRNLYNLQYFSAVYPEPVQGSEENLVNLIITVEEQQTIALWCGMTLTGAQKADDIPISLYVKVENTNFRGRGESISAGTNISPLEQTLDFSYGKNYLFNKPIFLSESISFFHKDASSPAVTIDPYGHVNKTDYYLRYHSLGGNIGSYIGRRWLPSFAIFTLSGGMSNTVSGNIYDPKSFLALDASIEKLANKAGIQNALFVSASLDARDVNFDPSKGWFFNQRLTWNGLIPKLEEEFFLRTDTKAEGYLTLFDVPLFNERWNFKAVLAAYSGLSMVFPVPNTVFSESSKVFVDGIFNGRGWTGLYASSRGKVMWSNRLELRLPIVKGIIGFAAIFDAVAVKEEVRDLFSSLKAEDFYFSTGPALRILIPQFPLHFLFMNTFKVVDGRVKMFDKWRFTLSFNFINR